MSLNVKQDGIYLHLCGNNFAPLEPGNVGIGFMADDFYKTSEELKRGRILDAADGPDSPPFLLIFGLPFLKTDAFLFSHL